MSLNDYKQKRNFGKTPEPKAKGGRESQRRFVVQEHHASSLHYDFRLEALDKESGQVVLKSWAIPKNVPQEPKVKRLAVQTEDHPVDYIDFAGEIPEGEYGAGTVSVWDKGKWEAEKIDWDKGELIFRLQGTKLQGEYVMIKTKGYGSGKQESWLIWKRE
jgi:DNA ligase D-like protein (predicted 3'-phosphoesterase)